MGDSEIYLKGFNMASNLIIPVNKNRVREIIQL